jgi:NAD(P)-dependent dehydrogenase (short-subunit alcohol dehydrogenase family)
VKELRDRVAVVTGAASGIGRAMAERFAGEGMKVVLADIEEPALREAEASMAAGGAQVLAVRTDVSKAEDVEALAQRALEAFGQVHVVCNNAGVGAGGFLWERSLADWQWVLGVNLWGVIHGVRTFVPIMLQQGTEGHIVNTASLLGLITIPFTGLYNVTKYGVVALSETLYQELQMAGGRIGVSVLCPPWVNTQLADSDRNRPPELRNAETVTPPPVAMNMEQAIREFLRTGMSPEAVAEEVVKAIREERLHILTHQDRNDAVKTRMENILEGRNPTFEGF